MNDQNSKDNLSDFFNIVAVRIAAFIAFLTAIAQFINWKQDNAEFFSVFWQPIIIISLAFIAIRIHSKKRDDHPALFDAKGNKLTSVDAEQSVLLKLLHVFKNSISKWFLYLCIFVIVIIASHSIYKFINSFFSEKIIIAIANFDDIDSKISNITGPLFEELRYSLTEHKDVEVKSLDETITVIEGSDIAKAKGNKHKANFVIWGWHRKSGATISVTVYFEVLKKPPSLIMRQSQKVFKLDVTKLDSVDFPKKLANEMCYLVHLTLGLKHYDAKDYNGAIKGFTTAILQLEVPEEMIDSASVYFYRGNAYCLIDEHEYALADYNTAIAINPYYDVAYNNRGIEYAEKNDFEHAIADYNQAINLKPKEAITYNNRGIAYFEKDSIDRAINDYNQAINLNSNYAEAYNNRGNAYQQKGDINNAISDYNYAIKLMPEFAEAYYNRGNSYYDKKEFEQAILDFNKAIEIDPTDYATYHNRGLSYYLLGKLDAAITDYDKIIGIKYNFVTAYNNRGLLHYFKRDTNQAIADFDHAIIQKPDYAQAYNNRGIAYVYMNNLNRAIADFNVAIKLKPTYDIAYINRGISYKLKGNLDSAIVDFNQAIKLNPDRVEAYYNRGIVHKLKGEEDYALSDLKKAGVSPNNLEVRQKEKVYNAQLLQLIQELAMRNL